MSEKAQETLASICQIFLLFFDSAGHPKWLTGFYGKYLKLPKKPLRRYLYGSNKTLISP